MSDNSSNNKRIARNTVFLYLRMILLFIVNFYTTRVLLQELGTDDFGLYNVVAGFVSMLGFITQSMTNSIQRFINFQIGKGDSNGVKKYFETSLTAQLILGCILIFLFETFGVWFLNSKMNIDNEKIIDANIVFQTSLLCLLINVIRAPYNAIVIANEKMNFYAYVSIAEAAIKLIIAFTIGWIAFSKLSYYALLLLILTIAVFIWTAIYSKKLIPLLKFRLNFDKTILKEVLSFSGWNLFGAASGAVKSQGINVLMNVFFNVAVNAARGVAFQVLSGVQQFVGNFQIAINPQIVQSYSSGDKQRYIRLTYLSAKISLYLMWAIALPVMISMDDILNLWLGSENVPTYTNTFVQIILFTGLFDALGASISVPLYATGNIKNYQIITSCIKFLVLPISYVLYVVGFAHEASMYTSLILADVEQLSRVLIWGKLVRESPLNYLKQIVVPGIVVVIISLAIMYVVCFFLPQMPTVLSVLTKTAFSLVVSFIAIYTIGVNVNERKYIKQLIKVGSINS